MKNFLIFGEGVVAGFILAVVVGVVLVSYNEGMENLKMFDAPGEVVSSRSFKVLQVFDENSGLVNGEGKWEYIDGDLYFFINQKGQALYDDQIIKVPEGKEARIMGTFRYTSKSDIVKTVPVVMLLDKK